MKNTYVQQYHMEQNKILKLILEITLYEEMIPTFKFKQECYVMLHTWEKKKAIGTEI